jgi:hypothetical protein
MGDCELRDYSRMYLKAAGCTCSNIVVMNMPDECGVPQVGIAHDEGCPILRRTD